MRILENSNIQFVPNRHKAYIFSAAMILLSLGSLVFRGLQMGIDFQGGMEFVVDNTGDINPVQLRGELADALGQEPEVKTFGANQTLVRTSVEGDTESISDRITTAIETNHPGTNPEIVSSEVVGPRFAEDLKRGALYSVLGALLVIFAYILIRFEWRFSVGAVAALFHDVIITLGLFSLLAGIVPFSLQIDQTIIAAFLTIIGYSINDTVVVFDRIREYSNLFKTEDFEKLVNRSINNTISRTLVTSLTTLLVVVVLFIFGGEVLRGFAFALMVGIVFGTYSSIFVASPIAIELKAQALTRR